MDADSVDIHKPAVKKAQPRFIVGLLREQVETRATILRFEISLLTIIKMH